MTCTKKMCRNACHLQGHGGNLVYPYFIELLIRRTEFEYL